MNHLFQERISALEPLFRALTTMDPVTPATLPSGMPKKGVYLLSEGSQHWYVGRTRDLRGRIGRHCRPGATHRMAAFAFRLARETTGNARASYRPEGSRVDLMRDPEFRKAFDDAKARIRLMNLRYVECQDPVTQALLEMYAAVVLETPYNDFDTH